MNAQEFENMFVMTEELGAENAAPPRLKANDKQIGGAHYKKRLRSEEHTSELQSH